jgi:hypothetical protein
LRRKNKRRSETRKKNHTNIPMEGLWVFAKCAIMLSRMKKMNILRAPKTRRKKGASVRQHSLRLALILTFSPWEKRQPSDGSGFSCARPANPAAGFFAGKRMLHPLLEERDGVRSSLLTDFGLWTAFGPSPQRQYDLEHDAQIPPIPSPNMLIFKFISDISRIDVWPGG